MFKFRSDDLNNSVLAELSKIYNQSIEDIVIDEEIIKAITQLKINTITDISELPLLTNLTVLKICQFSQNECLIKNSKEVIRFK